MPHKDPEAYREYQRQYRQKNKEKLSDYHRQYHEKHKEKLEEYHREYQKDYRHTPEGKKAYRIGSWKYQGIMSDDYDALYENVVATEKCEFCGVVLTDDKKRTKTSRSLDHNHETGQVRGVLCHSCNRKDVLKS